MLQSSTSATGNSTLALNSPAPASLATLPTIFPTLPTPPTIVSSYTTTDLLFTFIHHHYTPATTAFQLPYEGALVSPLDITLRDIMVAPSWNFRASTQNNAFGDEGIVDINFVDSYVSLWLASFFSDQSHLTAIKTLGSLITISLVKAGVGPHTISPILIEATINGIKDTLVDEEWLTQVDLKTISCIKLVPHEPGPLRSAPHQQNLQALALSGMFWHILA
ncbi:hypothetical protein NLI96_g7046 [Meripilus lineatus]|uniref:Uncharacterized protein n=1 Tax=Meripilus lineatus TaxID=2056292 RepID=A0AAD5UZQ5_9APHY|nr:hypothetical protein NLI96_g7046 [Physisporinus lineatus]